MSVPGSQADVASPRRHTLSVPQNEDSDRRRAHGQSSKPSDGLHMRFPRYRYADMVRLQHRLVTEDLGLSELRLIMGTSMGAMHAWMWGYTYPTFARALVPLASNPVAVAGRNRVWRKLLVDANVTDPTWKDGEYAEPPRGMASALGFLLLATSAPLQWQKQFPTQAGGRRLARGADRDTDEDHRCQRHDLPVPRVGGRRPLRAPGRDHGAAAGDQLGGRLRQPAGVADDARPDWPGGTRKVRPDPDLRRHPGPRHALAAAGVRPAPGGIPRDHRPLTASRDHGGADNGSGLPEGDRIH